MSETIPETIPETIYFRENYRNDNDGYFISITEISNKIPESSPSFKPIFTSSNGWKIYNYPLGGIDIEFSIKSIFITSKGIRWNKTKQSDWVKLDNNFRDRFWEVSFVLNEFKHYCENNFK